MPFYSLLFIVFFEKVSFYTQISEQIY